MIGTIDMSRRDLLYADNLFVKSKVSGNLKYVL
jgi:hypothetical protein